MLLNCSVGEDRGKMEAVTDFIFLGSKITGNSDYNHKIKRHLLLGRKVMTNLDNLFSYFRHDFSKFI